MPPKIQTHSELLEKTRESSTPEQRLQTAEVAQLVLAFTAAAKRYFTCHVTLYNFPSQKDEMETEINDCLTKFQEFKLKMARDYDLNIDLVFESDNTVTFEIIEE